MTWAFEIHNVAGIREGRATIRSGVNAIRASNWQGKSSFIRAIKAAMGADLSLTDGEERGQVRVETPERAFAVVLHRDNGRIQRAGEPYLRNAYDRRRADLFAFLDEDNEVRRAVRSGDSLEPVLTEPLDLANIEELIASLQRERDSLRKQLERAGSAAERLRELEEDIATIENDLRETRARRDALDDVEDDEPSIEALRDQLSEAKSERAHVTDLLHRTENARDRIRDRLAEQYAEIEQLDIPGDRDLASELAAANAEPERLERDLELLESLYAVNSRIVEEDRLELLGQVSHEILDDHLECWICGEAATRKNIEQHLHAIRERIGELKSRLAEREEQVTALEEQKRDQDRARRRQQELQTEVRRLEDALADHEETLTGARQRRDVLEDRIADLESRVDDADEHRTELESEIKYLSQRLEDLDQKRERFAEKSECRDKLADRIEQVETELEQTRNQRDRIMAETRSSFDSAIGEVVALFETGFESAHLTSQFELVVARDGREVPLTALSEGEVELLGIVAALAGFEAYDVDQVVPLILLDGIGALAAKNIETLVDYLDGRSEFLVLTTYPENENVGDWEIDPHEWTVVSHAVGATN